MANLYTKTGDKGTTSLVGGSRISKADLRVECYGTVDEMGSALGFARSLSNREYVCNTIHHIQGRLFALGAEIASDRKSQVGSGDRSEKIRTYNFPQSRITDHRIGLTLYKLDDILNGNLDEVIEALITAQRAEQLKESMEN